MKLPGSHECDLPSIEWPENTAEQTWGLLTVTLWGFNLLKTNKQKTFFFEYKTFIVIPSLYYSEIESLLMYTMSGLY